MINRATILGRIGKKEEKISKSGNGYVILSIATNKKWKDKSGSLQQETTWHKVYCFSKLADIASKYPKIGDLIYIEGEIANKEMRKDNGEVTFFHYINCKDICLITQKSKSTAPQSQVEPKKEEKNEAPMEYDGEFDDEIPF